MVGTRARVASSVVFAAAFVGLFLPWDQIGHGETQSGFEFLSSSSSAGLVIVAAVVALVLGAKATRRASFARAMIAAVGLAPFTFVILLTLALGGDRMEIGVWVSFWALVGYFVINVIVASVGFRAETKSPEPRICRGE